MINLLIDGSEKINAADLEKLTELFNVFTFDILGLKNESAAKADEKLTTDLMKIIIDIRQDAKDKKEWAASDKIRNDLKNAGINLKDSKEGATWEIDF
jgi:cysteinyl-tRNA synthetase